MNGFCDIAIIGGGPAGLAAAIAAYDAGVEDIVILEREKKTGGILNQCIHNGFGLTRFKESLAGPEYAARFQSGVAERRIKVMTETTVLSLGKDKLITAISPSEGVFTLKPKAVVIATGCRERSRGALNIAGTRPAGIYSAGTAQKYANIKGYLVGKNVVILGSGDIGLIMARRMTLEGASVKAVFELMPYSSGLKRNIAQCLDDFGIPLYLSHTIVEIEGKDRVTGVVVAEVDENRKPIPGSEKHFNCDTVLFSVGLIPENELAEGAGIEMSPATKGAVVYQNRETSIPGVFACGNALQVHDLVDFVSDEAEIAGRAAAAYVRSGETPKDTIETTNGDKVSYVLPQKIDKNDKGDVRLFFRVRGEYKNCAVVAKDGEKEIVRLKKRVVAPGEMEKLVLPAAKVAELSGKLTVSLEVGE